MRNLMDNPSDIFDPFSPNKLIISTKPLTYGISFSFSHVSYAQLCSTDEIKSKNFHERTNFKEPADRSHNRLENGRGGTQ